MDDFRSWHLPYCIKKLQNGTHIVLNRSYKPIGFRTSENLEYEAYPIGVKFKRLTSKTVARLSWKGSQDANAIFLYSDSCIPTVSAKHMNAYLERLGILAKLKFAPKDRGQRRLAGEIVAKDRTT